MEHKSRSIILKVTEYGEADRLVTFFAEDNGKHKGIAKHAKRSKKRFGGGFEIGSAGILRYNERPNVELVRLEDFQLDVPAWKMTSSLAKITALHIAAELADKMIPAGHASVERFNLLSRWLAFLCDNEPTPQHVHSYFYKWLVFSGLQPDINRCVSCNKEILLNGTGRSFFDDAHGGIICDDCYRPRLSGVEVDAPLFEYLNNIKAGKLPSKPAKGSGTVFQNLIFHAIGGELRALDFYRRLEV